MDSICYLMKATTQILLKKDLSQIEMCWRCEADSITQPVSVRLLNWNDNPFHEHKKDSIGIFTKASFISEICPIPLPQIKGYTKNSDEFRMLKSVVCKSKTSLIFHSKSCPQYEETLEEYNCRQFSCLWIYYYHIRCGQTWTFNWTRKSPELFRSLALRD